MTRAGLRGGRIGMEMQSLFLTPRNADAIREKAPGVEWRDASGLVDVLRLVKSPLEMDYTRRAAKAADAGTLAAIEATRDGASDYEVAAGVPSRHDPRRQRVSGLRSLHPADLAPGRGAHDMAG